MLGRIGCLLVASLSLSGCFGLEKQLRSEMRPTALVTYNVPGLSYVDTGMSPSSAQNALLSETAIPIITEANLTANGNYSADWRNVVQNALLDRSDRLCSVYLDDMYVRVTARKFALKEIAEVSTFVATVVGSPWAQNLTIASTIASQTNNISDSEILQGQLTTLIGKKIQANRRAIYVTIRGRQFQDNRLATTTEYPISTALADANRYHSACSFLAGLQSLENTASTADSDATSLVGEVP